MQAFISITRSGYVEKQVNEYIWDVQDEEDKSQELYIAFPAALAISTKVAGNLLLA